MCDGVVARTKKNRTADEKNFGIQLDSLCDVVCFGVFPAVILFFSGVNTVCGLAILIFYALCAVIRLAFFNVLETKRQVAEGGCAKGYRGLPVTSAAIILPFFYLSTLLGFIGTYAAYPNIQRYMIDPYLNGENNSESSEETTAEDEE